MINYVYYALVAIVSIAAMVFITLIIDLQTSRILSRQPKGRLISRNIAQKIIVLSEKKEKEFDKQLKTANVSLNAREFYFRTLIMSAIYGIVVYFLATAYIPGFMSILMTLITVGFGIYYPFSKVRIRIRNDELRKSIELPRFLKNLTTLLRTQTAYDAIKESIKYAPPTILPHAETLLIEVTQYPKSSMPYDNFAKNLGLRKAKQFMNLLYQSLDISQKSSRDFIEKLNQMTDDLEDEAAKTLSLLEASSMTKYNYIMLACIVCLPLALALVTMMNILQQFN